MQQETFTLVVTSLGIVGTLSAVAIGHFLSRSLQTKQWRLDRRNEEFKQILESLGASMLAEVESTYQSELTPQERKDKTRKTADFFEVVQTRIFTSPDVRRLDLAHRWNVAVDAHKASHNLATLERTYKTLMQEVVDAAMPQKVKK